MMKVALVKFVDGTFGVRRERLKTARCGFLWLRSRKVLECYEYGSPKGSSPSVADYWWTDRDPIERFAHLAESAARKLYRGVSTPFDAGDVLEESDYVAA